MSVRWVLFCCLLLGVAAVFWRAHLHATASRERSRVEAAAYASALESQFSQATSAVEILAAVARQNGGSIPNFQRLATEVLASRPGVATLEIQPGGVVADVVPRAGNDKMLGFNVMKDSAQGPGAYAATQVRGITVAGPLPLFHQEQGVVARSPIFERGSDGRDYFRGFVAASMRLQDALRAARVNELSLHGYDYMLFVPGTASRKGPTVATYGTVGVQDAAQQAVRVQNLEFRLAIRPIGGWLSKSRLALELVGVLIASGCLAWLVNLIGTRAQTESALADANERLTREAAGQKQGQDDLRRATDEVAALQARLKQEQVALTEAVAKRAESQAALETNLRSVKETDETTRANLSEAEAKAANLQKQLVAAVLEKEEALHAFQKEQKNLEAKLRQTEANLTEARKNLDNAAQVKTEASSADTEKLEQANARIRALEEELKVSARSAAEAAATSTAKLKALEATNAKQKTELLTKDREKAPVAESSKPAPEQHVAFASPVAKSSKPAPKPVVPVASAPPTANDQTKKREAPSTAPEPKPVSVEPPANPPVHAEEKAPKVPKRKKNKNDNQMDLFAGPSPAPQAAKGPAPGPARKLPPSPPVDPPELRKAVNAILPLLMEQDPGAKDCLRDNTKTFRSAFSPEAYVEFAELIQKGDFGIAREELTKAAKRHGIPA